MTKLIVFDPVSQAVKSLVSVESAEDFRSTLDVSLSADEFEAAPEFWPAEPYDGAELRWDGVALYWHDTRTLGEVKAQKRQELAAMWNMERQSGVTLGGKVAPTDADSWTRYLALKAMAEDAGTWVDVPIPLKDGTFELLTLAKAQALWTALKALERTLLVKLRDKIDEVQAATTVADIDAVTWD